MKFRATVKYKVMVDDKFGYDAMESFSYNITPTFLKSKFDISEIDELKSQVAELTEKLSQQDTSQEYEETKQSGTQECQLTFDDNNIHEISQQLQHEGYPYYSFNYPDSWVITENMEYFGYSAYS